MFLLFSYCLSRHLECCRSNSVTKKCKLKKLKKKKTLISCISKKRISASRECISDTTTIEYYRDKGLKSM